MGQNIMPGVGTLFNIKNRYKDIKYKTIYKLRKCKQYKKRNSNLNPAPISQRSVCPWIFRRNIDNNRVPRTLYDVKCACKRAIGLNRAKCKPVFSYMKVLRRKGCVNGIYEYIEIIEPVSVGCTAVRKIKHIKRLLMKP